MTFYNVCCYCLFLVLSTTKVACGHELLQKHQTLRENNNWSGNAASRELNNNVFEGGGISPNFCGTQSLTDEQNEEFDGVMRQWTAAHPNGARDVVTITTYFHIITNDASTEGVISESTIEENLDVLNQAFLPHGFQFIQGEDSPAYVANDNWFYRINSVESSFKTALRIGGPTELNVYTKSLQEESEGLLGFAYLGQSYCLARDLDGVVIDFRTFPGQSFAMDGDVLTHEVGHFLGLRHTFENGCSGGGDGISDTPSHKLVDDRTCDTPRDTCGSKPGNDPIRNYMNYVTTSCMNEFTEGQANAMRATWDRYRAGANCFLLTQSDNSCFSPIATATVNGKGEVAMKDVMVGDEVLTAGGEYKTVYAMNHFHHSEPTNYIQIHTNIQEDNYKPIELTADHMIFVQDKTYPVMASEISIGDVVQTVLGPKEVTDIKVITRNGLYNPLTTDGSIIVDGIVASTYTSLFQEDTNHIEVAGFKLFSWHALQDMSVAPYRTFCMTVSLDYCNQHGEGEIPALHALGMKFYKFLRKQNAIVQICLFLGYLFMLSIASCVVNPYVLICLGFFLGWNILYPSAKQRSNKDKKLHYSTGCI